MRFPTTLVYDKQSGMTGVETGMTSSIGGQVGMTKNGMGTSYEILAFARMTKGTE